MKAACIGCTTKSCKICLSKPLCYKTHVQVSKVCTQQKKKNPQTPYLHSNNSHLIWMVNTDLALQFDFKVPI